jgi:hypothetical protein
MISPPPMMMPTPIHQSSYPTFLPGMASPLLMQAGSGGPEQAAGPPAAMAFTYVPIPVYNLGGMQMTGDDCIAPRGLVFFKSVNKNSLISVQYLRLIAREYLNYKFNY